MSLLDVDEIRDAIEWDLITYRRQSLKDLYQGRITLREYCVFIGGLPADSRLVRVLRPYQPQTDIADLPADVWETTEHLLATIADKLELLYLIQLDPKTRPSFQPIPRPGRRAIEEARPKRGRSAWFGGMGIPTEE